MAGRESKQYEAMLGAISGKLRSMDIYEAAERAGMKANRGQGTVSFECLGRSCVLKASDLSVSGGLNMWEHLAVLQYLENVPAWYEEGEWVDISTLEPGDVMRGASFNRDIDRLAAKLGKLSEDEIKNACSALGGRKAAQGRADISMVFCFLPRYPLLFNLWLADDEFPASGKVLINSGAGKALGLEAAGTVALGLVQRLCEAGGLGALY